MDPGEVQDTCMHIMHIALHHDVPCTTLDIAPVRVHMVRGLEAHVMVVHADTMETGARTRSTCAAHSTL